MKTSSRCGLSHQNVSATSSLRDRGMNLPTGAPHMWRWPSSFPQAVTSLGSLNKARTRVGGVCTLLVGVAFSCQRQFSRQGQLFPARAHSSRVTKAQATRGGGEDPQCALQHEAGWMSDVRDGEMQRHKAGIDRGLGNT